MDTIDVDFAIEKGMEFYHDLKSDKNARYLSWEHCYSFFKKSLQKPLDDETVDVLCLHLGFYLSSWGMYRGSSFLLQKDYRVHRDIVIKLYEDQYTPLWGASCELLLMKQNLDLLMKIVGEIEKIYVEKRRNIDNRSSVSDILISKILMGTLGCIPAYDRFFVETTRQYKVASGSFNSNSIRSLAEFYLTHKKKFELCRLEISSHGVEYPPMKIIDMCFWQMGYEQSQRNEEDDPLL